MRSSRRDRAPAVSFTTALFEGLAPDGGLYVPETIEPWADRRAGAPAADARSPRSACARSVRSRAARSMPATLEAVVVEALNFPIPLVEVEPNIYALELFHGPTLAFKDVGARVMARLMASLHEADEPLTVLAATSGDTGSAVAHAFHGVPHTRVVVLYPDGRVSPTQEAQLTMFNGDADERARLRRGRQLRRLSPADARGVRRSRAAPAHAADVGQLGERRPPAAADGLLLPRRRAACARVARRVYLLHAERKLRQPHRRAHGEASRSADRAVRRRDQRERRRAGVSRRRAASSRARRCTTISNAMDVGNPSNFERMSWLYGGDVDAMRRDIHGSRHTDDDVRETIRGCTRRADTCSIRTARLRTWGWSGRRGR